MFSWPIAILILLAVLWWAALSFVRVWLDGDERTMRDYQRARDRFEDYFE
jgi:hypothetical protein